MSPKNSSARFSLGKRAALLTKCVLFLLAAGVALTGTRSSWAFFNGQEGRAVEVAGVISGTVFQDYNYNGKRDTANTLANNGQGQVGAAVDRGIAGVTVTAYDANNAVAGTATSGADGSYSLNASGTGPYRVEFTNLPAGFFPGPVGSNSRSNVQFVAGATASNVDFGIAIPAEYCQDNPTLVTSCYVGGPQTSGQPVIVAFPYSSGSTRNSGGAPFTDFDAPAHANLTTDRQVGTLWGVAYARSTKTLYFSSFMKKHAGFGPAGLGVIYTVNPATGNALQFFNLGALAGTNPHDQNDFDRDNGNVAWDAVGKVALGGMALNGAETRLYAMNLAERSLYEFPTDVPPTSQNVRKQAVPVTLPGCPSADDVRPPVVGDTDSVGYTSLTGGSSTAFKTGWAAYQAGMEVRRQMIERAAMMWRTDAADLVYVAVWIDGDGGAGEAAAIDEARVVEGVG